MPSGRSMKAIKPMSHGETQAQPARVWRRWVWIMPRPRPPGGGAGRRRGRGGPGHGSGGRPGPAAEGPEVLHRGFEVFAELEPGAGARADVGARTLGQGVEDADAAVGVVGEEGLAGGGQGRGLAVDGAEKLDVVLPLGEGDELHA